MKLQDQKQIKATWFYNPFVFWGGSRLFWMGTIVILIHIPIGYFLNVRFDGALDMHLVSMVNSWLTPLQDVTIAWLSMFLCFYLAALIFKSPIRLIDIAGATGVARIPILLSIIPAKIFEPETHNIDQLMNLQGSELYILIAGGFIILLFFVWFLTLLFNAFKINSNLKGWKLWTGFLSAVAFAEIISLITLSFLS